MGGRGSSSGISAGGGKMTEAARSYEPYARGQITRTEAGIIYKAARNGDIDVKPETTQELYKATESYIRFSSERYSQDYLYYDRIYSATRSILNNDFATAQKTLNAWEDDNIKRSTKKSIWHKYK